VQPNVNVVNGTSANSILVASNDNINSTEGPSGIIVRGGQNVTSVSADSVSHTFTVPSLNLNIPVPVSSTVVAYFTVDRAGTYAWFCMTACGDPAMSSMGWMTGSLAAS
jgi:heme/copper-type cytochrome/quinol oxidase subunit 2